MKFVKDWAPSRQSQSKAGPPADSGDFLGGMGNLVVLELARDDSGILVMPRERVAFLVRPTDCLLMNVHHMHGNLPLTFGGTRLTAVLYARQKMHECG